MSVNIQRSLPHVVQNSAISASVPEGVGERNHLDVVPMLSGSVRPLLVDGEGPVSKILTVDGEDGVVSGVTEVQRPFSLADHDVECKDRSHSEAPLLLRCPKGGLLRLGFASYDLVVGSWQQLLPTSVLLPQLLFSTDFAGTFGRTFSGGGLLLMEKFSKQQCHLVVSNPTSNAQRQLPPMMEFSKPEILGIFVDNASPASYKIPVVHRKLHEKEMDLVLMQEYDSLSNSWEFAGQWRNRFQVEPTGAAYVNGTLFFLTYDRQAQLMFKGRQQRVHHIYYLNDCEWERLELPLRLVFPAIFEYRGRLMLAGGLQGSDLDDLDGSDSARQSVCIWEHEWSLMRWAEVCNMPGPWVDELYKCAAPGERRCTLEVTAGGNFVCFASSNGKVTKCDVTKNDWAWLPKCDLPKYADSDSILILERRPDIPV